MHFAAMRSGEDSMTEVVRASANFFFALITLALTRSPGTAPSTKTTRPSTCAIAFPSKASFSIVSSTVSPYRIRLNDFPDHVRLFSVSDHDGHGAVDIFGSNDCDEANAEIKRSAHVVLLDVPGALNETEQWWHRPRIPVNLERHSFRDYSRSIPFES